MFKHANHADGLFKIKPTKQCDIDGGGSAF